MYDTTVKQNEHSTLRRAISFVLAVAMVLSSIIVGIPSFILRAKAIDESGNSGVIDFKDADIDYDSNLVANPDGTFSLTLDFSAGIVQKDQNVSRTVSGDGYYVAPMSGYYTIQLWGGDGGNGSDTTFNHGGKGGKGGYVYTAVKLEKGDIIAYRLGGNGAKTLKTEEGGGVNGDGGNHGDIGSFYIGGGGGYSIAYLYKNGKDANYFIKNFTKDGEIVPVNDDNKEEYEKNRTDFSKLILIAGGGGGGGAGDRLNAEQIAQLIFNKPNGNADGGAGGKIGNQSRDITTGTVYFAQDGFSSGKNKAYIGRAGTDVPGVAPEGRWSIVDADDPNDWFKTVIADEEGGTGSSGNLRGGGGGAGYCGGSGGIMTSLINSTNVGGGGGGSSFVVNKKTNSAVVGLEGTNLNDDEILAIKNDKNHRPTNSDGNQGGYVMINLLDEETDTTSLKWIREDLSFTTEISKYFTVEVESATTVATVVDPSNANKLTFSNFALADTGKDKIVLKLTPIAGFAGGNDVNLFASDTDEFKVDVGTSGQGGDDIDLGDTHSYVNIPLNGFSIKADSPAKYESGATINLNPISCVDATNTIKNVGSPKGDFLTIGDYKCTDSSSVEVASNITKTGKYTIGFTVTPKVATPAKAEVGNLAVAATYSTSIVVSQKSAIEFNDVGYEATQSLTYDDTSKKYTYTVTLTTTDVVSFQQISEAAFYTDGVTYYNNNAGSGVSSNTFTAAVPGEYIFYALGGPGGDGGLGHANQNSGAPGNGGQVAGKVTLDANQQVIVEVGSKGQAGDKASSMFETGDCGQGGFATSFKMNGGYVLVAGGGGGGGGGAANGTTGGGSVDNNTVETSYNSTENYYNGSPNVKSGDTKKGGNAGHNFRATSVTSATFTGLSNANGGAAKIVPSSSKKDATEIANQIYATAGIDKINFSALNVSTYFSDVNMANVNAAATTTLVDKQTTTSSDAITGTSYHMETTTAKVSKTWTFTFSPDDNFLGGYDVPVFTSTPVLSYDSKETAVLPEDPKVDYANVRIINPTTLTTAYDTEANALGVAYGTRVQEDDLFNKITDTYIGGYANYDDLMYGANLPLYICDSQSFTNVITVSPINASPSLANAGPEVQAVKVEKTAFVDVATYSVNTAVTDLSITCPSTVIAGDNLTFTLAPANATSALPEEIKVEIIEINSETGDKTSKVIDKAQYEYDVNTGVGTIPSSIINGNVKITAVADTYVPAEYKFHLLYSYMNDNKQTVGPIQQDFTYVAGTSLSAKSKEGVTSVTAAMAAAEAQAGTAPAGYTFVWDWTDGALATMPDNDYWLFGSMEPYSYNLEYVCTFPNRDDVTGTEKVWYTAKGKIDPPSFEGYVLKSASDSTYDINLDFVNEHKTNGATIDNFATFAYDLATDKYTVRYVRADVETDEVVTNNIGVSPEVRTFEGYKATPTIEINGNKVDSLDGYTPVAGDVVVLNYSLVSYPVEMIDKETGNSYGFINVEKGGYYNHLYTIPDKMGTWYYDIECTKVIHTDDSEFDANDYKNGTVDITVDKIYVVWSNVKFTATYNPNGGTINGLNANEFKSVVVTYDDGTKSMGSADVTYNGFALTGWTTTNKFGQPVGSGKVGLGENISTITDIARNIIYFKAIWIPDTIIDAKCKDNSEYTGAWVNQDVTLTISNGLGLGLDEVTYAYSTDDGKTWTELKNGDANTDTLTVTTHGTTSYIFKTIAKDGTEFDTESITVKIDTAAPTGTVKVEDKQWKEFINTITFGIFFNKSTNVSIIPDVDDSGDVKVEYYVATGDDAVLSKADIIALDAANWTTGDKTSVDPDERFVVYAKLTDNAGNVTYLTSDGISFDQSQPVVEITSNTSATTPSGGDTYADRLLNVSDDNLKSVTITKVTSEGTDVINVPLVEGKVEDYLLENDGSVYTIVAEDAAGNKTTYVINSYPIESKEDGDKNYIDLIEASLGDEPTKEDYDTVINAIFDFIVAENGNLTDEEKAALNKEINKLNDEKNVLTLGDIEGTVVDGQTPAQPVAGADVTLKKVVLDDEGNKILVPATDKDGNTIKSVKTDEDGNYIFENVPDGEYVIEVSIPKSSNPSDGNATTTIGDVTTPIVKDDNEIGPVAYDKIDNETGLSPADGKIDPSPITDYKATTDIKGKVEDKNGRPASNAIVELLDKDGNPVLGEDGKPIKTTTDKNGEYVLPNISDGEDYQVKITAPSDNGDGTTDTVTISDIDVKNGKISKDVVNNETGKEPADGILDDVAKFENFVATTDVAGTVVDKNNIPVPGATVELLDKDGKPVLDKDGNPIVAYTDENGNYVLKDVPEGDDYQIKITSPKDKNGDQDTVIISDVDVSDGNISKDKNKDGKIDDPAKFNNYDATSDITGVVTDKNGDPVPGATVELLDKDGNPVLDKDGDPIVAYTDENGNYILEDVPDGEYQIKITAPYNNDGEDLDTKTVTPVKTQGGIVSPDTNSDGKLDGTKFDEFVNDKVSPEVTVNGTKIDNNKTETTSGDRTVVAKDDGIKSVVVKKTVTDDKGNTTTTTTTYTDTDNDGIITVEISNDEDAVYEVIATDNAGNTTVYTVEEKTVDTFIKELDEDVDEAIDEIEKLLDDESDNLSSKEKEKLQDKLDELLEEKEANEKKPNAKTDIQNEADKAKKAVDELPNLTPDQKEDLKKQIQDEADKAKAEIEKAKTPDDVDNATNDGKDNISDVVDKAIAQDFVDKYASGSDNDPYDKKDDKIGDNVDQVIAGKDAYEKLTPEQKALVDEIISTPSESESDSTAPNKYPTYDGYEDMLDTAKQSLDEAKQNAKDSINKAAEAAKELIDAQDNLTPAEKEAYKKQIDDAADKAKQAIDKSNTPSDAQRAAENGKNEIDSILADALGNQTLNAGDIKVEVEIEGLVDLGSINASNEDEIKEILSRTVDEDDISVFENDGHITIVMTVREIETDKVNEKAIKDDGNILFKHIEIVITKNAIGSDGKVLYSDVITHVDTPISFVVPLGDAEKEGRIFYVYADHTGKTVAERSPDGDGVVITPTVQFTTSDFSVFSIAYEDDERVAKTLDDSPIVLSIVALAVSATGMIVVGKKKRSEEEE